MKEVLKADTEVYLCGSIGFMNSIEKLLTEIGQPSSKIHIEAFQPSLSIIKGVIDRPTQSI